MRQMTNACRQRSAARRPRRAGQAAFALGVWLVGAFAATAAAPQNPIPRVPPDVAVEDPPVFPLSQVQRGLKGYGYTVFASADGPERFEFEVLGVMRGYLGPGEDLIIAQLKGEKIERTGVIAGMSGSPVYVDGKLVGAVGYRFGNFTKDPIAGITPIERMKTAASAPAVASRSPAVGPAVHAGSRPAMTAGGRAEPIAIPVAVSGVHPVVLEAFSEKLDAAGYGPRVAAGGAGRGRGDTPRPFYASGPIAGTLVDGDIAMSGIGTVTWVKGKRFLAFGHPFNGTGQSVMPVSNAEILTTVAASSSSWKLGQATVPVGRLTDDRLHAIAGTMGEFPKTVDVTYALALDGPRVSADATREVRLSIMRDGADAALFTAIGLANTLLNRVGAERGGTVDLGGTVKLSTGDVITLRDRAALDNSAAVFIQVALGILGELASVVDSGLKDVQLDEVRITIRHRAEVERAELVAVRPEAPLVAGKQVRVRLQLQPHEGKAFERVVTIDVPRGAGERTWTLEATDPDRAWRLLRSSGHVPQPTTWERLLASRALKPAPGSITLLLRTETEGVWLQGDGLATLPPSLSGLLDEGGGLQGTPLETRVITVGTLASPGLINGRASTKVWVSADDQGAP